MSSSALRMVSVGQAAPDFKLNDQNGKPVSLSSFKNKKKVVVSHPLTFVSIVSSSWCKSGEIGW